MTGHFIVIEGIDGSGGTTQVSMLLDWLHTRGHTPVLRTREPTDGPIGRLIRSALAVDSPDAVLGDPVLPYLFAADRRDHLDRVVGPAVAAGGQVVSDRYYHSSLAYQSAAIGFEAVAALNAAFRPPDITLFLDLSPADSLARVTGRGETLQRFETLDRLETIAAAYAQVLAWCAARGENVVHIDARGSREDVHQRVVAAVAAMLAGA